MSSEPVECTLCVTINLCPRKTDKVYLRDLQRHLRSIMDPAYAKGNKEQLGGPVWALDKQGVWLGEFCDKQLKLAVLNPTSANEATLYSLAQLAWHHYGDEKDTPPIPQLFGQVSRERVVFRAEWKQTK